VVQRWSRYAYLAVASVFLAAVLLQVFLAGLSIFASESRWATHVEFGRYMIVLVPLLIGFGLAGNIHGRPRWMGALLITTYMIQGGLPVFADSAPWIAALHPVNALVVAWFAAAAAWTALAVIRSAGEEAEIRVLRPLDAGEPAAQLAFATPLPAAAPVVALATAAPVTESGGFAPLEAVEPLSDVDEPEAGRLAA